MKDKIEPRVSKTGKRSKLYVEAIDREILERLTKGDSPMSVQDWLMNDHGYKLENCKLRMKTCLKRVASSNDLEFEEKVAKYREMYLNLYKEALESMEIKTANGVVDSMVKLEGLLTQKIEAKIDAKLTKIEIKILE